MSELVSERFQVNHDLALAYLASGDIKKAEIFSKRAWLLSPTCEEALPMYEKVMLQSNNLMELKDAYRRVGEERGIIDGFAAALPFFYKSMYVFAFNGEGDRYIFDRDMLNRIRNMAREKQFQPIFRKWSRGNRKLRVAYLVYGAMQPNSVIVKILKLIAKNHDRDLIEYAFFIPENEIVHGECFSQLQTSIKELQTDGNLVVISNGTSTSNVLDDCARQIYDYSPDILVTSALLADLKQYYIAALRPAPIIIGMTHGPPQQFSDQILDWSISWDPHAHADCISNSTRIPLEIDLPVKPSERLQRSDWNLNDEHIIIIAAGREIKFLDQRWWCTVSRVLRRHPQTVLLVVGMMTKPVFVEDMLKDLMIEKRVRIFGWLKNYHDLLSISDIMIDTHPSGGGVTLMEGMAYGLPSITFKNNFLQLFDQTDWSPGEWIVGIQELIADHGDFEGLYRILDRLIIDDGYRNKIGKLCKNSINERLGSTKRMVSRIEKVYEDVAERLLKEADNTGPLPEPEPFYASMIERKEFWQTQETYMSNRKIQFIYKLEKNLKISKITHYIIRYLIRIIKKK